MEEVIEPVSVTEAVHNSYVYTPSNVPFLKTTIGQQLMTTAIKYPDKEAIVVCGQIIRKTYSEYMEEVNNFAAGLIHIGLRKGDRIGILVPNCYEFALTQFAAAQAGLILVPINNTYSTVELEYCLKKVSCRAIVSALSFKDQDYYKMFCTINPDLPKRRAGEASSDSLPDLSFIILITSTTLGGTYKLEDVMEAGEIYDNKVIENYKTKIQFDDPALILFTSGTTNKPKAVTLSHFNVINNAYFVGLNCDYHTKDQRICVTVPLYHCFGCVIGTLASVVHGLCVVLPSPHFKAGAVLKAIEEEKCTSLYGTPIMLIDILDHPEFNEYNVSTLFTGIIAGFPCPIEVMKRAIELLNLKDCTICYGMSETSPVITQTSKSDSIEKRISTVGKPLPFIEVKIVNNQREIVPINTQGELLTRGYITMLGYWEDKQLTEEAISLSHWYSTGDLAMMDEDGYIKIKGLVKDHVIKGGCNINPTEIEQFLHTHPDIKEAQVIGIPDEKLGEEICAWIQLKSEKSATDKDIKDFCKGKIDDFKIPRYFIIADEFPRTLAGKVQKYILKDKSVKMLF